MTNGERCISIFARATGRSDGLGRFMTAVHNYVYAAALPEGDRVYHGMPVNFDAVQQGQHLRADYNDAATRKGILNGHTADFDGLLEAAGIAPETHAAAIAEIRGAMNDYLRSHTRDGLLFDNDGDFRRNTADAATIRVGQILGLG